MINKTRMENEALEFAVGKSGEFLERMADGGYAYDMSSWPVEAYTAFIEEVVTAFVERMQEIKVAQDVDPPFP